MGARYVGGLGAFLRQPLRQQDCRRLLDQQYRAREESFLRLLERGVYGNPRSPYRTLLEKAGIHLSDIAGLLKQQGMEGCLERLHEAGVYISLDEFKGRSPLCRPGLEIPLHAEDFDNPLLQRHYEAFTGGSRGAGRRLVLDLDQITRDTIPHAVFQEAFGLVARPMGVWRPCPPNNSGIKKSLMQAKLGRSVDRWFSQNRLAESPAMWKYAAFTWYTTLAARFYGSRCPAPEYTPLSEVMKVTRWMADCRASGNPAYLDTAASGAVRVCMAAREHGLDISGSLFRTGGEPLTAGKARAIRDAGAQAVCHYTMSEIGPIGMACADASALDDVHVLQQKAAVIQRRQRIGPAGVEAGVLYLTSLTPVSPKIMLNVESGDYAVLEQRRCGCPLGAAGLDQHLHTIRSYEKLTSEGMTFLGGDLLLLLEEVLPRAFGGSPTDYQFVEEEDNGLPRVNLVVSPRVGALEESRVVAVTLEFLASRSTGNRLMAGIWRQGETLRLVRREPYATHASKILALHVGASPPRR